MEHDAVVFAKLSVQRALLGNISDNVRAVVFTVDIQSLRLRFYIDQEISEANVESASCVETEVIADYGAAYKVAAECVIRCMGTSV